jgi:4-diphosphocytidyl-2-C-methyl-D-erythritol kinase
LPLVLVWPGRPVSTAAIFGALRRRENPALPVPPSAVSAERLAEWLAECRNDLEGSAIETAPEIDDVLARLRLTDRCLLARMSGSGAGCFGLYRSMHDARAAAATIEQERPGWWIAATVAH